MTRRVELGNHRGYAAIGLDHPKTDENVGAVMRAAFCFGASLVVISGDRLRPGRTDVYKAWRHIPFQRVDDLYAAIPYNCVPVAVELTENAKPLREYHHPERAFYIFGAEDGTLGGRILAFCRDVVRVSTRGCLNLAACVNVVLYDREAKNGDG